MGIDNDKLLDLVATTLKDLPKQTFEVAWTNQDYEFAASTRKSANRLTAAPASSAT
jgi:hypothetical protein